MLPPTRSPGRMPRRRPVPALSSRTARTGPGEGTRGVGRIGAVVPCVIVQIAQPFGVERGDVRIEGGRADVDLRVAGPAHAFVTLRAVRGDVDEVAAHALHDVLVQPVHQRVGRLLVEGQRLGVADRAALAAALLGAFVGHRLRERPRALRIAALVGIALLWIAVSIAWYRSDRQLIGVPYDIAALTFGAWLANRTSRRTPA